MMEAGRELDALIAKHVTGWKGEWKDAGFSYCPSYSKYIQAAWPLLDRFVYFSLTKHPDGFHISVVATKESATMFEQKAPTVSHAISLVSLRVVGVDVGPTMAWPSEDSFK